MSTPFYDLASLVVVPSGYKASKVYAQKPLTTDGQLTFSRASTATRVNASGLIETVASNVPRLDYLGSTCPKILLEPQRSNVLTYSSEFDNAAWTKSDATVTANSVTSPDGTTNADTITGNGSSGLHIVYQTVAAFGANYTISIFAKKGTNNFIQLYTDFVNSDYANFDLNTGTVGSKGGTTGATSITHYGNGWYRCTMVTGSALSGNVNICLISAANSGRAESNALATTVHVYGAQLEAGAYATSLINTTTAAVTRLADMCRKTGISSLSGQTEGTIYWEGSVAGVSSTTKRLVSLSDGTINNAIYVQNAANGRTIQYVIVVGGTQQFIITVTNAFTFGEQFKIAAAYKANDFVLYVNGVQVGSTTSGSVPATSKLSFDRGNDTIIHEGNIAQSLLFKTRLTPAQLAEITTL